jgi:CheY-like chemotaxis protein
VAYTEQGAITVTIRRESTQASVAIRDTGIGLEANVLEKLFEPFTQVDNTRDRHGLGLGLALVKNLVDAHGGTVAGRSAGLGQGSEFLFTLPLAAAPVHGRTSSGAPTVSVVRRILVVDDQHDVADTFGGLLESLGQDVRVAHSGEEALAAAREFRPAVAFLDLAMPGMNGAELARRLREEFPDNGIALVAVTGFGQHYQAGSGDSFDHRLLKPVTADQAAALLNSLV